MVMINGKKSRDLSVGGASDNFLNRVANHIAFKGFLNDNNQNGKISKKEIDNLQDKFTNLNKRMMES